VPRQTSLSDGQLTNFSVSRRQLNCHHFAAFGNQITLALAKFCMDALGGRIVSPTRFSS
jgi:hypothetical protein